MNRHSLSLMIPEQGAEALRSLLDLGHDGIVALCKALTETGPVLAGAGLRAKLVHPLMNNPDAVSVEEIEDILMGAVYPIHNLQYIHELPPETLYAEMTQAIKKMDDWPEVYAAKWTEMRDDLLALSKLEVLGIETKGAELLRDRANRVRSLRLFSDVRPLFTDQRDKIQANVLTNTLCVHYIEGSAGRRRTAYFSLDPEDLTDLKEQVEKAEQKNQLIIEQHKAQEMLTLMLKSEASNQLQGGDS